jgi:hypothetical protein
VADLPDCRSRPTTQRAPQALARVGDEFTGDPTEFQERHYNAFFGVTKAMPSVTLKLNVGVPLRRASGE